MNAVEQFDIESNDKKSESETKMLPSVSGFCHGPTTFIPFNSGRELQAVNPFTVFANSHK